MNWKFLLNQWVRILHCNIYVVNRDYEIEKVYGDLIAESSPLYMDPEFFMMLVDRKVKEYPDIYCEYNSVLYASMPFESKKLVIGPVSIIKPTRELEKFMTDTHFVSDRVHHQTAFCDMKVFGAGVLALYHCISGKELTIDELWQKNGLTGIGIGEAREHRKRGKKGRFRFHVALKSHRYLCISYKGWIIAGQFVLSRRATYTNIN